MSENKNNMISDERKTHDLQSVARMIAPLAKNLLGKKGFVEVDIITNWDKIVGEELADYTFPQSIDFKKGERVGGTLMVVVPSGAFALELQHREKIVMGKINTYFGYNAVARLKILQNQELALSLVNEKSLQKPQKTLVTMEEENYISDLSKEVTVPELQQALQKLGRSILGHNKGEKNKK